jgi:hypothetical protein
MNLQLRRDGANIFQPPRVVVLGSMGCVEPENIHAGTK